MVLSYKTSNKINYPVFPLVNNNWTIADKLVTIDGLILDDKNMSGKTLGQRRLQTPYKSLFPIKKAIESYIGVIKQPNHQSYIDNKGILFSYEKTKYIPLVYVKIERVERKKTASLVYLKGYSKNSFEVLRPPSQHIVYAGVLFLGEDPWMLYDYSIDLLKTTRRKI